MASVGGGAGDRARLLEERKWKLRKGDFWGCSVFRRPWLPLGLRSQAVLRMLGLEFGGVVVEMDRAGGDSCRGGW